MSPTFKAPSISGEGITDGIDINMWTINRASQGTVTYSVWDFAGQTIYYNTHQVGLPYREDQIGQTRWGILVGQTR